MENSLRKDRLLLSQNFALYYGHNEVEMLTRYDIAIVEPKGQSKANINRLKMWNTVVITYLSFMEVHPSEPIFRFLEEKDFLKVNGKKIINKPFGTYLVDLKSTKWMEYLLKEIQHRLIYLEADGIFIDTIGDIEGLPEGLRFEQINALVNLLYVMKLIYPKHLFIQNNGLEYICLHTAPYLDGICWENPPVTINESAEWVGFIINRLLTLKENWKIRVFFLLEESIEKERKAYLKARRIVKENGFLIYNAPKNYVEGVSVVKN